MMKTYTLLFVFSLLVTNLLGQELPPKAYQIALAVHACPAELRSEATVLGYNENGTIETLKTGDNHMVALADNPTQEGISVACYHKTLDPFMARGRELRAEGKGRDEIFQMREAEAKAGTLPMPEVPAALYVLSGKEAQFFPEQDSLVGAHLRYVVYTPFATAETTGLSPQPSSPGEPWIMFPGTHAAHIMITPPRNK